MIHRRFKQYTHWLGNFDLLDSVFYGFPGCAEERNRRGILSANTNRLIVRKIKIPDTFFSTIYNELRVQVDRIQKYDLIASTNADPQSCPARGKSDRRECILRSGDHFFILNIQPIIYIYSIRAASAFQLMKLGLITGSLVPGR